MWGGRFAAEAREVRRKLGEELEGIRERLGVGGWRSTEPPVEHPTRVSPRDKSVAHGRRPIMRPRPAAGNDLIAESPRGFSWPLHEPRHKSLRTKQRPHRGFWRRGRSRQGPPVALVARTAIRGTLSALQARRVLGLDALAALGPPVLARASAQQAESLRHSSRPAKCKVALAQTVAESKGLRPRVYFRID
jgi:hypothetical protein